MPGFKTLILALPILTLNLVSPSAGPSADTTIDRMPADLETRYALSALPPALRDRASVYLLDPANGYQLARQGENSMTCLVQRTVWELGDYRNDIYFPLCYDAAGTKTYLKVIMDAAKLRAGGMGPPALKAEIGNRWSSKAYSVPDKAGLSYMVGPVMRTVGPPDMQVHTMPMPHFMFYAPYITNDDIAAVPDLSMPASLLNPFIDRQGIAEQSYIIQMVGQAEKAKILADEKPLLDDLCWYRDILCLGDSEHGAHQTAN